MVYNSHLNIHIGMGLVRIYNFKFIDELFGMQIAQVDGAFT